MQEAKARCPAGGAEGRWVPRADMGEAPEAQVGACWEAPSVCGSGYVKHPLQIFKIHSLCVLGV